MIKEKRVLVISQDVIGNDRPLGEILMKSFMGVLAESEDLPETIIFYNSGVKLAVEEGQILDDIKTIESKGVEVLSCGTCLGHYEMKEKLKVGKVSNMYDIVAKQMNAELIIKPC